MIKTFGPVDERSLKQLQRCMSAGDAEEIVPGDEVYAYSQSGPEPTRVAASWPSGMKPVHTISLGSRRLRCSGSHPILTLEAGEPVWRETKDLEAPAPARAQGGQPAGSGHTR